MEFKGKITRVFRAGDWSSGTINCEKYGSLGFAGACYPTVGSTMILQGELTHSPKWGKQIKVESGITDLVFDEQGLVDYLADETRFKNIGPVRAAALIDFFEADLFQVIVADPDRFADLTLVKGITLETAQIMHDHWLEAERTRDLMIALRQYGLNHAAAIRCIKVLGNSARTLLESDPYRLIDLVHLPFGSIDVVERAKGIDKRDPRRIAGCTVEVLRNFAKDGHTCVALPALVTAIGNRSGYLGFSLERLTEAANYRTEIKQQAFSIDADHGALLSLYQAEYDFAQWVYASENYPSQLARRLETNIIQVPEGLTEDQEDAYRACLTQSVTWIFGLAGTGKTHSARLICDLYASIGATVLLMAPTGKAAKRLSESTGRPASTIHRSLMCKVQDDKATGKPRFDFSGDALEVDLVLVDEISMVDSELMGHLIRRINLATTSVIFLGDINQLVPVGPGQPALDIHAIQPWLGGEEPLTTIVRQAGELAHYCVDVLEGKVRSKSDYANGWIVRKQTADDRHGRLLELFNESWMEEYDTFSDVQVLTPQNNGPLGVNQLNVVLQEYFQLRRNGVVTKASLEEPLKAPILPGDKVIQTANDYNLGIFNGDTGVVLEVITDSISAYKKGSICVDFGFEDPVWLSSSGDFGNQTKNLKLGYALTVHKAQGSEYPCVIAIVDKLHKYMLTRSWLYTAVTRAQETVCLLGQSYTAQQAAERRFASRDDAKGRKTLLQSWLFDHFVSGEDDD